MKSLTSKTTIQRILLALAIILLAVANVNCSSGADPVAPGEDNPLQNSAAAIPEDSNVFGIYDVVVDPATMEISVTGSRELENIYNIGFFIDPQYINATILSFDLPNEYFDFELELTNPFNIDVYDVRVLLIPYSGGGSKLLNYHEYTKHFNTLGDNELNGFKAYAKNVLDRKFGAGLTHSDVFEVQGLPFIFQLLIEGSLPSNTEEPIEITGQYVTSAINSVTGGVVETHAFDHQSDISLITVDTTAITGSVTNFVNTWGDYYESAVIYNTMGAAPGIYECLITASSPNTSWDLYDFVEIEVISDPWIKADYPITTDPCSMDLGVIEGVGGTRDSQILMADSGTWGCDMITAYYPDYSGTYSYVSSLSGLDPSNDQYDPFPVQRIDAADTGAFSITNRNQNFYTQIFGVDYFNSQVWSVFDANLQVHTGASPDTSRYINILAPWQTVRSYPVDVCDDFNGGQYALFTTDGNSTGKDLVLCGTMPDTYTHDRIKYMGNLDSFVGAGPGLVSPDKILGIDVYVVDREDYFTAKVYILEKTATSLQIEVFSVSNTNPGWQWDLVDHELTIDVNPDNPLKPHDIELLPPSEDYDLNPSANFPTVCLLASQNGNSYTMGHVMLFNAYSGMFLEDLATYFGPDPMFKNNVLCHLDVDDGDFEIHVTRYDETGVPWATIFSHL